MFFRQILVSTKKQPKIVCSETGKKKPGGPIQRCAPEKLRAPFLNHGKGALDGTVSGRRFCVLTQREKSYIVQVTYGECARDKLVDRTATCRKVRC